MECNSQDSGVTFCSQLEGLSLSQGRNCAIKQDQTSLKRKSFEFDDECDAPIAKTFVCGLEEFESFTQTIDSLNDSTETVNDNGNVEVSSRTEINCIRNGNVLKLFMDEMTKSLTSLKEEKLRKKKDLIRNYSAVNTKIICSPEKTEEDELEASLALCELGGCYKALLNWCNTPKQ
ncbi:hypothetical protein RI129_010701 [Pyrocoelia pectoralis]|uniref:Uncharacterized protein n=1 Tax=Pyrocoelia pectoralis TaxID=417401 RepID=A0AAN7Z8Y9_9COLE